MPSSPVSWGTEHESAFKRLQKTLKTAFKFARVKKHLVISVFTRAGYGYCARVVPQTKAENSEKDFGELAHEPLTFLGGQRNGIQRNWTTYQKKAFAIVKVFEMMDHVRILTYQRNVLYVFAQLAL